MLPVEGSLGFPRSGTKRIEHTRSDPWSRNMNPLSPDTGWTGSRDSARWIRALAWMCFRRAKQITNKQTNKHGSKATGREKKCLTLIQSSCPNHSSYRLALWRCFSDTADLGVRSLSRPCEGINKKHGPILPGLVVFACHSNNNNKHGGQVNSFK